jgi:hypothetical protein
MSLLTMVERHLRREAVAPSRFGREAAGDPRFVFDLRRGREPRPATEARVRAFMMGQQSLGALQGSALVCGKRHEQRENEK